MSNFFEAGKAAMTSNRDDWETPQALFDKLDAVYHFTLDPCSTHENAKCAKHYTVVEDGLAQSWQGERVFCNPPYGRNIGTWVKKCAEESKGALVVMLIPARTDTAYFHDYIYRKAHIEFLRGRLKFERGGVGVQSAPFPSMLVIWGRNDAERGVLSDEWYVARDRYEDDIAELTAERDQLSNAINELQRKQPYCYNPEQPLDTLNTIGRYIDELTAERDALKAHLDDRIAELKAECESRKAVCELLKAERNYLRMQMQK